MEHYPLRIKEFLRRPEDKAPQQLEATGLLSVGDMVVAINGKSVRGTLRLSVRQRWPAACPPARLPACLPACVLRTHAGASALAIQHAVADA